jgi:glutaredoxin
MIIAHSLKILSSAIALASFLAVQPASAEKLYKWVDKNGNVTYQSDPPPDDAWTVERSSISTGGDEQAELDAVTIEPVQFYSNNACPDCDDARVFLQDNNVPFNEIDVSDEDTAGVMEKYLGHNNVPTFVVGNKAITGYQEQFLQKVLINSGYELLTVVGEPAEETVEETTETTGNEAAEQSPEEGEPEAQPDQ